MSIKNIARQLRRDQTDEEKQLWRALRGRRFAGFKFRRQHAVVNYILDFYCPIAQLAIELDGFQHGLPQVSQQDTVREKFLIERGIVILRFWNYQWHRNREGCLLEIWDAVQQRSGCVRIMKNADEQLYVAPDPNKIKSLEKIENPSLRLVGPE